MSNSSDAFVGAAGMNARKRGLSHEITAGASTSAKIRSTSSGSLPDAFSRLPARVSNSSRGTEWSSGTGSSRNRSCVYSNTARAMRSVSSS